MPFEPGKSGNPGGRVKDKPFGDALRMEIAGAAGQKELRAIARVLLDKAKEGDMAAIKELIDRSDGKAAQQMDVDANLRVTHDQWIERLQLPGSKE